MFDFLCKIGIHKYSSWKNFMYGKIFRRVCKRCGKEDIQNF